MAILAVSLMRIGLCGYFGCQSDACWALWMLGFVATLLFSLMFQFRLFVVIFSLMYIFGVDTALWLL